MNADRVLFVVELQKTSLDLVLVAVAAFWRVKSPNARPELAPEI
jgi:hypothetical protein